MRLYKSSTLITTLLIMNITLLFFINYYFINDTQEKIVNIDYKKYLKNKLDLTEYTSLDKNKICSLEKTEDINYNIDNMVYTFSCKPENFFLSKIPSKKYINISMLEKSINLSSNQNNILHIISIQDFPANSYNTPKIIYLENEISGRLINDFYGIVITHDHLYITDKKIYGTVYSPYPDDIKNRHFSYDGKVLNKIQQEYSKWYFLDNSINLLNNK